MRLKYRILMAIDALTDESLPDDCKVFPDAALFDMERQFPQREAEYSIGEFHEALRTLVSEERIKTDGAGNFWK